MRARKDYIHRVKKTVRLTDPRCLTDAGAENVFYFIPRADILKSLEHRALSSGALEEGVARDEAWKDDMWDMHTGDGVENMAVLDAPIEQL